MKLKLNHFQNGLISVRNQLTTSLPVSDAPSWKRNVYPMAFLQPAKSVDEIKRHATLPSVGTYARKNHTPLLRLETKSRSANTNLQPRMTRMTIFRLLNQWRCRLASRKPKPNHNRPRPQIQWKKDPVQGLSSLTIWSSNWRCLKMSCILLSNSFNLRTVVSRFNKSCMNLNEIYTRSSWQVIVGRRCVAKAMLGKL